MFYRSESKTSWFLGEENTNTPTWVPLHNGIKGNETVDNVIRWTQTPIVRPAPFCCISSNIILGNIEI